MPESKTEPSPPAAEPAALPPGSYSVRISLKGRESEAKEVTLAPGENLEPQIWEYLRALKVDRDSFTLFNETKTRRFDPSWPADQAGFSPGDLILIGDSGDFPDPLAPYRECLRAIVEKKVWPIAEETGLEMLAIRERLCVAPLEHQTYAREAGMPPDDAQVLADWKPKRERTLVEYGILLKLVKSSATIPESAFRKLADLRAELDMSAQQHLAEAERLGIDETLARNLLEPTAPVSRVHAEYVSCLVAAKDAEFSSESLNKLKDLVLKSGINRDVHRKLASQAGIPDDVIDACFEDQDGLPTGRRFYARELLAVARARNVGPPELARLKALRDKYTIKKTEHSRLCRGWGIAESEAESLWSMSPPRSDSLGRILPLLGVLFLILAVGTPAGRSALSGIATATLERLKPSISTEDDIYDASGFDKKGFDRSGRDRQGFDRAGYDRLGFDRKGYNRAGFDSKGYNRSGRDRQGYDRDGFDRSGYGRDGFDRKGVDRYGYDREGYDRSGFNRAGFNRAGFNKDGFDRKGYDKNGYDRWGYDRRGFDRKGFNRKGVNRDGFGKTGFNQEGRDKDGYDQNGLDRDGFDRDGFDKEGYNRDGFNRSGFDHTGRDREGRDKNGFDRKGFGRDGFDLDGFDKDGFGRHGRDRKGFDRQGYDRDGFDRLGFGRDGFNRQGRDRKGFDRQGIDAEGYDREGYDREGFNRQGKNRKGYYHGGFKKDGYDAEGYNRDGFNHEGVARDGTDLLPGPLATLQNESGMWRLRVGAPPGNTYSEGTTVGPYAVEIQRIGGNIVVFKYRSFTYDRRIEK